MMVGAALGVGVAIVGVAAGAGTTPMLQEVFLGRCAWAMSSKGKTGQAETLAKCTALWNTFEALTAHTPLNSPTWSRNGSSFDSFFRLSNFSTPKDKAIFWSGTEHRVHEVSPVYDWPTGNQRRFWTMEDTIGGSIANGLRWCGGPDGYDYDSCPAWPETRGTDSFWAGASTAFAKGVSGAAFAMVRGVEERSDCNPDKGSCDPGRPAFRDTSFFATYELPNLSPERVTNFTVLLIHNTKMPHETCTDPASSVVKNRMLERIAAQLRRPSHAVRCVDDLNEIRRIVCADEQADGEGRAPLAACMFVGDEGSAAV